MLTTTASLLRTTAIALVLSPALIAFMATDAAAKSPYKWNGGLQVGVSTDRNIGGGGKKIRDASDSGDEDEDEDEDDMDDDFDDDILDDLDLEDDDVYDDLEEYEDDEEDALLDPDGDGDVDADLDGDGDIDDEDELALPSRRITKGKRDERLSTKANIGVSRKLGDTKHAWKAGGVFTTADQRDSSKNDNYVVALSTGPVFKFGDLSLNPSVSYARLNKDGKHIFDAYATAFGASYKVNKKITLKSKFVYDQRNFESSKIDEVYGKKFSLGLSAKPFKDGTLQLGYGFKTEDTTPAAKEKDRHEIKAAYQHDLPMDFFVVGEAGYKWTDYDAAKARQPIREDEEYTYGLSIGHTFENDITLELQYDHRDANTNIANKDISNDRFALVGAWKF